MNIHAKEGDKVIHTHPNVGYASDRARSRIHLTVGHTYTVDRCEVRHAPSKVFLKEIPGVTFSSDQFDDFPLTDTVAIDRVMQDDLSICKELRQWLLQRKQAYASGGMMTMAESVHGEAVIDEVINKLNELINK